TATSRCRCIRTTTSALFWYLLLAAFSGSFIGSAQAQTAVDDQCLPGNEITAGDQAENSSCNFVGAGDPLEREAGRGFGDGLGIFRSEMLAHPRRVRKRRRHTVHANPRRQRGGESFGQIDERCLSRTVRKRGQSWRGQHTRNR